MPIKKTLNLFSVFIVAALCFSLLSLPLSAMADPDYLSQAKAVYLYSYDANRVLISKGENEIIAPCASAKMMTGLIACEMLADRLDEKVLVTSDMLEDVKGNSMGLKDGMELSVRDLLYGTICGGNNDAAQILAIVCHKNVPDFVKKMNFYASSLYMKNTRYSNPSGLDSPSARTTVNDTAILARRISNNTLYMEISNSSSYEVKPSVGDPFTIYNRNGLESQFYALGYINNTANGIMAGKDNSSFFVCSTAEYDGMRYLCIVMGAEEDEDEIYSYYIANELFDYAFTNYSLKRVISKGTKIGSLAVDFTIEQGEDANIACIVEEDVYALIPNDVDPEKLECKPYFHEKKLFAPIEEGDVVGGVNIYYDGTLVATSKLVASKSIDSVPILLFLESAKSFLTSRFFIMFICFFVVFFVLFLVLDRKHRRSKNVITISKYKGFY